MKYIPLRDTKDMKACDIITSIVKYPGSAGINLEAMRPRIRLLDALEANEDPVGLLLEDADAALLARLVKEFPFGIADKGIVDLCDGIINAKAPPAPMSRSAANGHAKKAKGHDDHTLA